MMLMDVIYVIMNPATTDSTPLTPLCLCLFLFLFLFLCICTPTAASRQLRKPDLVRDVRADGLNADQSHKAPLTTDLVSSHLLLCANLLPICPFAAAATAHSAPSAEARRGLSPASSQPRANCRPGQSTIGSTASHAHRIPAFKQ